MQLYFSTSWFYHPSASPHLAFAFLRKTHLIAIKINQHVLCRQHTQLTWNDNSIATRNKNMKTVQWECTTIYWQCSESLLSVSWLLIWKNVHVPLNRWDKACVQSWHSLGQLNQRSLVTLGLYSPHAFIRISQSVNLISASKYIMNHPCLVLPYSLYFLENN